MYCRLSFKKDEVRSKSEVSESGESGSNSGESGSGGKSLISKLGLVSGNHISGTVFESNGVAVGFVDGKVWGLSVGLG